MKKKITFLFLSAVLELTALRISAQPNINLVQFGTGLSNPVDIANAGDSRLFVVEQNGYIRILDSIGNLSPAPFLDIDSRVGSGGSEQGLLGLAFHPDYASNGYFYVNYTGNNDSTHISRFNVSSNPDSADASSEVVLLTIYQPFTNHNGGDLDFGPDGYLYIPTGDGGSGGDPGNRAQDSLNYLGKILRINVDSGNPYSIPPDNPFIGNPGALDEIWAIGLRNPWRFSFDRSTGDMWNADVGQSAFEEVNFQPASGTGGDNYGWKCYEANAVYDTTNCSGGSNYIFPVFDYPNTGFLGDCSVTGGYVYRGTKYSGLAGHYVLADYCSGKIWTVYDSAGTWANTYQGDHGQYFSSFGEDASGEMYIASLISGIIYHVQDSSGVGIAETGQIREVDIFPNPFDTQARILLPSGSQGPFQLEIIDMAGKLIKSTQVSGKEAILEKAGLTPGMYLIVLTGDQTFKGKFMVR